MRRQAVRQRGSLADGPLHDVREFGGMGGGENEPLRRTRMLFPVGFPAENPDCGVRVRNVSIAFPYRSHLADGFLITRGMPPDLALRIFQSIAAQVHQARTIVGI